MSENNNSQSNRSIELCRRVVTTESFIAEAKEIYGDRYDYSKVDYKNRDHRVVVTCPIHGDFQVYSMAISLGWNNSYMRVQPHLLL